MKTIALPSLGTRQPTMLSLSVMTNKEIRKIQFGGWNKKRYKQIRKVLKVREEKELGIRIFK